MGIPDGLRGPREAAYVRKQEEKSFRGLLKLFNRACDATGRPRYEDGGPSLPLGGAAETSTVRVEVANCDGFAHQNQALLLSELNVEDFRPPQGSASTPKLPPSR